MHTKCCVCVCKLNVAEDYDQSRVYVSYTLLGFVVTPSVILFGHCSYISITVDTLAIKQNTSLSTPKGSVVSCTNTSLPTH